MTALLRRLVAKPVRTLSNGYGDMAAIRPPKECPQCVALNRTKRLPVRRLVGDLPAA